MTREMLNNPNAQFTARYEVDIFAPPDKVWDWLSRVELWTTWRQDVSNAYWATGDGTTTRLKWRIRKVLGFTAEVEVWKREREIRWNAVSYGTRLRHVIRIEGDFRRTTVTMDVTGSGGLLRFFPTRSLFKHHVNRSNEIWFGALKTKLEFGKDESTAPPAGTKTTFASRVRRPSDFPHIDR